MKRLILFGIVAVVIGLMILLPQVMLSPGKLVQGHRDLNSKCDACHQSFGGVPNQKCVACHKVADIGRDTSGVNDTGAQKKTLFHQNLAEQKCITCHTDHIGFNPHKALNGFSHDLLPKTLISNCNSCHSKPMDEMHNRFGAACGSCHNTGKWDSAVVFNHDLLPAADKNNCLSCHRQPVNELHKQVSTNCSACHNFKGWKTGVIFNHDMIQSSDKTNCSGCHQKPADAYHNSFNANCDKCHTTAKWQPSTFNHSSYFLLDQNHNAQCNTCHTNSNLTIYTCYGCHEHSESRIIQKHSKEGIYNITRCASCHKSGNEHDIEGEGGLHKEMNQKDVNAVKDYANPQPKGGKKDDDD